MSDGMDALIGRQVCIMTKAHRRYTGKLSGWDKERRVVWVDDVHGHGTEGRAAEIGEAEQPPNPQVFESIEFNGKDLVDLRLIDDVKEQKQQQPAPPKPQEPIGQPATSRPPQQQPQESWPSAPSHGFPPPPAPQQQGGFQGPPGPGGPYGGWNQPIYPPNDRWGPPPPIGGPPQGSGLHGPPPPDLGRYGMYGGPQFPPYGAPVGPNFPPPGGRQFPNEQYAGYPPFGQGPPPPPGQAQPPFPPQQIPPPVEMGSGSNSQQPTPSVEPKTLSTQAPPPAAQPSVSQPRQVTLPENHEPVRVQLPPASAKAAAPPAPTGPRNSGKVVPAMPMISKPVAREHTRAQAPVVPAAAQAVRAAVDDATQAATAAVAAAMAKLPPLRQQQNGNGPQQSNNVDHLTRKTSEMRINDGTARPPRHPNHGESGFAGRGGAPRGGATRGRGGPRSEPRKVEVPKDDFDFESSNAKFNKQDLVKEVIAGDSVHEASADEEEPETHVPASSYNKKSSFFDDLSSEAKTRAEDEAAGKRYGREWRGEEQKRNVETFGQGSVDNGSYRGGTRGRGRGRGGYRGRGAYSNAQPGRGRGGYQGNNPRQPTDQ